MKKLDICLVLITAFAIKINLQLEILFNVEMDYETNDKNSVKNCRYRFHTLDHELYIKNFPLLPFFMIRNTLGR